MCYKWQFNNFIMESGAKKIKGGRRKIMILYLAQTSR
jgi:hypothetical protein